MTSTACESPWGKKCILIHPRPAFVTHTAVALGVWKSQKDNIQTGEARKTEAYDEVDAVSLNLKELGEKFSKRHQIQQESAQFQEDKNMCCTLSIGFRNEGPITKVELGPHNVMVSAEENVVDFHISLSRQSLSALVKAHVGASAQQQRSLSKVSALSSSRKLPLWRSYALTDLPPKKRSRFLTCCREDKPEEKQKASPLSKADPEKYKEVDCYLSDPIVRHDCQSYQAA